MTDWASAELGDDAIALEPWDETGKDDAFRDPELGRYFGRAIGDQAAERAGFARTGLVREYAEFKDGTRDAVGFVRRAAV